MFATAGSLFIRHFGWKPPDLDHEDLPHNTMSNAEQLAASMRAAAYAFDDAGQPETVCLLPHGRIATPMGRATLSTGVAC